MSTNDNRDFLIEKVELVHSTERAEQRYTGTIRKNSSPPESQVKSEYLPPNFKSIVDRINTGDRVAVIMRGLPGSGKSFIAQQIIEQTVKNPVDHIVSADNFFMQGGIYRFDKDRLGQAHEVSQATFIKKASLGYSPLVVDNTNMQYWEMANYITAAVQYEYHVEILEPSTPWKFQDSKLALKNVHGVPLASIKRMKSNYETGCSLEEFFRSYCLIPVKVPKKRSVPAMPSFTSSHIMNVARNVARNVEMKPVPSSFKPIRETTKVDGGVKKFKEWELTGQKNWEELPVAAKHSAPSPDSTTTEETGTPKAKSRKNKKNKKVRLVPHRKLCPNENPSFSLVRDIYPNVDDSCLWDLFVRCDGESQSTLDILLEDNKSEQMPSGNKLTCSCFTTKEPKQVEIKRNEDFTKNAVTPPPSAKKTKQEQKQSDLNEWLDTKAAIEQSIKFSNEHYPEHVNKVKEWKALQTTATEASESVPMSTSQDIGDELHALTIPQELILELDEEYGGGLMKSLMANDKHMFPPQIFIKKSVAHLFYLEIADWFCSRQEEQRIAELQKDQKLAKELQEQEQKVAKKAASSSKKNAKEREREFLNGLHSVQIDDWEQDDPSEESLAKQMSKEKLLELFPEMDREFLLQVWKSNDYNFNETVESVKDSLFCSKEERDRIDKAQKEIFNKPWTKKAAADTTEEQGDAYTTEQLRTVDDLREEIADHYEERKALHIKAEEAMRSKNYEVATYYSDIAAFHKMRAEECQHEVANLVGHINENTVGSTTTLDLHLQNSTSAQVALDNFLDKHISTLKSIRKPYTELFIITGRGNNSVNGIPIIKQKTKKRLLERKLKCKELNPGYLGVRIHQDSLLSHEA